MKTLLRFLLLIACLISVCAPAMAQYVSAGPNGGVVYSFYRAGSQVYAAGSGGIYVTVNEGKSWTEVASTPSVFGCDAVYSVVAFGADMYAGTYSSGIFQSHDGG